jgi:hypothetical protein
VLDSLTRETHKTRAEVCSGVIRLRDDRIVIEPVEPTWSLNAQLMEAVDAISRVDGESLMNSLLRKKEAYVEHLASGSEPRPIASAIFHAVWHEAAYEKSGTRVRVLFIHDLDWTDAATALFWKNAIEAANDGTAFVVCARKVSPQAFSVCKKIGARALQYYMPISERRGRAPAQQLERSIGWFGSTLFDGLNRHAISEHLHGILDEPAPLNSDLILRVSRAAKTQPSASLKDWKGDSAIMREILTDTRDHGVQTSHHEVVRGTRGLTPSGNEGKMFGRKSEKTRLGIKAW